MSESVNAHHPHHQSNGGSFGLGYEDGSVLFFDVSSAAAGQHDFRGPDRRRFCGRRFGGLERLGLEKALRAGEQIDDTPW